MIKIDFSRLCRQITGERYHTDMSLFDAYPYIEIIFNFYLMMMHRKDVFCNKDLTFIK